MTSLGLFYITIISVIMMYTVIELHVSAKINDYKCKYGIFYQRSSVNQNFNKGRSNSAKQEIALDYTLRNFVQAKNHILTISTINQDNTIECNIYKVSRLRPTKLYQKPHSQDYWMGG